jgi:hypothetical protein
LIFEFALDVSQGFHGLSRDPIVVQLVGGPLLSRQETVSTSHTRTLIRLESVFNSFGSPKALSFGRGEDLTVRAVSVFTGVLEQLQQVFVVRFQTVKLNLEAALSLARLVKVLQRSFKVSDLLAESVVLARLEGHFIVELLGVLCLGLQFFPQKSDVCVLLGHSFLKGLDARISLLNFGLLCL